MLTNHINLLVPTHSWNPQQNAVTAAQGDVENQGVRSGAEKEEKMVIKGTGGQIRQEREFLAAWLLRYK